jgi:hypothetical protein
MRSIRRPIHPRPDKDATSVHSRSVPHWLRGLVCFAALSFLAGSAHPGQGLGQVPAINPDRPYLLPEANRLPNVNDQMRMRELKVAKQNFDAINLRRKKQIAEDSENLVTLAMALKAEVDHTTNSELSANALRKADGIEKLAHNVKEKMQLTVGTN